MIFIQGLKYTQKMPKKCNVYGCRGNYRSEPYTKVVQFPTDETERNRWIVAMPNERSSLLKLKQIYACANHFDCDWMKVKGGKTTEWTTIDFSRSASVMLEAGPLSTEEYKGFSSS